MTNTFAKTTATVAAWNLVTFEPFDDDQIKRQVSGLSTLDVEFIILVEIKSEEHIRDLAGLLSAEGATCEYSFLECCPPPIGCESSLPAGRGCSKLGSFIRPKTGGSQ